MLQLNLPAFIRTELSAHGFIKVSKSLANVYNWMENRITGTFVIWRNLQ